MRTPRIRARRRYRTMLFAAALAVAWLPAGGSLLGQAANEILVRGGEVVTVDGRRRADIRVVGETIAEIGAELTARGAGAEVIDARGLLVLPGGIDPHVHVAGQRLDDYTSGSAAALAGGITTISNFSVVSPGEAPAASVEREAALIRAQSIADVIVHPIITEPANANADTLGAQAAGGQTSIKVFMNREPFDRDVPGYIATMEAARDAGLLVMMHAEDGPIIRTTAERMVAEGRGSLRYFADARPVAAEVAATQRAVALAEVTGAPVYLVHLSSERALQVAEDAAGRGLPVYVETRPIYLHLTRERFAGPSPGLYIGQPALRTQQDQNALWAGLARGAVHVVATDHVAYTREQKLDPAQTVADHRPGMSNLQVMLPMLFSEGVAAGRLTLEQFVAVTATNAAKLFGLYPRKGTIAVGADADLALWDPDATRSIRDEDMLSRSGYSTYAGTEVTGWPTLTMRRGEVVYRDGAVAGAPGSGELLRRERWREPAF